MQLIYHTLHFSGVRANQFIPADSYTGRRRRLLNPPPARATHLLTASRQGLKSRKSLALSLNPSQRGIR